jgi:hypothetical protein
MRDEVLSRKLRLSVRLRKTRRASRISRSLQRAVMSKVYVVIGISTLAGRANNRPSVQNHRGASLLRLLPHRRPILLHPLRHLRLLSGCHPSAFANNESCLLHRFTARATQGSNGIADFPELRFKIGFLFAEGVEDLAKAIRHESLLMREGNGEAYHGRKEPGPATADFLSSLSVIEKECW